MTKIIMEAEIENMIAVLKEADMWKDKFLEDMCEEDLLEFGIKQGYWELVKE